MHEQKEPLISCVMPTYNRREFVPHAIRYFLQQDYDNKELIIIDDGTDLIQDLVPDHPSIRYFQLKTRVSLGKKLNLACSHASGDVIAHWDDDDWYSPARLRYQAESLKKRQASVCGINRLLYYDVSKKKAFQYIYPKTQRKWLLGSSLCYNKSLWEVNRFAEINVGMDGLFVWNTPPADVAELEENDFAVHMIHHNNISPKNTNGSLWQKHPVEEIENLLAADWAVYKDGMIRQSNECHISAPEHTYRGADESAKQAGPVRNVFACLVHENEACVIDLVQNLHHNDPASVIILYNGGAHFNLLGIDFPFHKFNAVVYPDPLPMKHGYLHRFALDTMEFALRNFSFDTFTVVDSDQLSVRRGYSDYLGGFLSASALPGMLSSTPERVARNDNNNYVASRAFREYDLWKPLLQKFSNGDDCFVHWTFWPSTVFFSDAVKDLTTFFKKDDIIHDIMQKSAIWATEEVILPTLVKLLGHEIAANPCSYQYVKYRQYAKAAEIPEILNRKDAYWIHPVDRDIDDPVRNRIRDHFSQYPIPKNAFAAAFPDAEKQCIVKRIKNVEGWLTDAEALFLIDLAVKVCREPGLVHDIVEVGSYHGKSTILVASVLKQLSPGSRLTSVDPHDGVLGDEDQGLHRVTPSLESFKKNIGDAGVSELVETIRKKSVDVLWNRPLSLLIIDGLHDYRNVSRDFYQFSEWIKTGGFVAFHDYAPYFPSVMAFVDSLAESGTFKKCGLVDSLSVLQKIK